MKDDQEQPGGDLVQSANRGLTSNSGLVRRGLDSLMVPQPRFVYFPTRGSLGRLFVQDNRSIGSTEDQESRELGEACGRVEVPDGLDLELLIEEGGTADFSPLALLQPNDLQNLVVHPICRVRDSELKHLTSLAGLLRLSLNCQFDISDLGLKYISGLTAMRYLDLTMASGVTSGGLKHLRHMRDLECLILLGTKVDDEAIEHLRILTSLKYLNLEHTHISDGGAETLKASLTGSSVAHKHRAKKDAYESVKVGEFIRAVELDAAGVKKDYSIKRHANEGKKKTGRVGVLRSDPTTNSLSEEVRARGGLRPDKKTD